MPVFRNSFHPRGNQVAEPSAALTTRDETAADVERGFRGGVGDSDGPGDSGNSGGVGGRFNAATRCGLALIVVVVVVLAGCHPQIDSGSSKGSAGSFAGQSDYRDPSDPLRAVRPAARDDRDAFVGSDACKSCHADIAELYAGHPMSGSLVELRRENPPREEYGATATFSPRPDRKYLVERTDDGVLHHEQGIAADGRVVYDQAEKVEFAIGSGKRGRSYVLNRDGILFMSPISWYSRAKRWDLSPAYDPARHVRFERPANDRCLQCHTGRMAYASQPTSEATQKYAAAPFQELMIGCERCHGPGRRHVEKHQSGASLAKSGEADDTIVNPARLDPQRHDDVCNQCHLGGEAQYLRYGRQHQDFRPGDHLGDIWTVFVSGTGVVGDDATRAVSHVGQMRSSKCYSGSGAKLVCSTCHDAHSVPKDDERNSYFDRHCLKCHGQDDCAAPAAERTAASASGSCIHCHMPRLRADDVPHTTQTDHRIRRSTVAGTNRGTMQAGKSADQPADEADHPRTWRIFDQEEAKIPTWERRRARGLLYAQLAEQYRDTDLAEEATRLLRSTCSIAADDVDVLDALGACARVLGDEAEAAARWEAVLRIEPNRQLPLYSLALMAIERRELSRANEFLTRLTKVNPWQAQVQGRHSMVLARLGRLDEAVAAAERARALDPSVQQGIRWLAELYRNQGRLDDAKQLESQLAAPAPR